MTMAGKFTALLVLVLCHQAHSGLLNIFDSSVDYDLADSIDAVFGAVMNDMKALLRGASSAPIEEDVTFWCGKRGSPTLKQTYLNDPNLSDKINLNGSITFITHGWLDNVTRNWFQNMAQDVLTYSDTNVCGVNWAHLAQFNYYTAAINHTVLVSDYLTTFIRYINGAGIPLEKITLVGHSMGAQISGQTGNNLGGQIAKIYGLDPAGPCFTMPIDRGLRYRLDRSDAKFVQTIITSRGTIGVAFGDGHENFYPNGGASPQTNCILPLTSDAEFYDQIMCSHLHATSLFRYALNPAIQFKSRKCGSYASFMLKLCFLNEQNLLGVYSKKSSGDYYLQTSAVAPYNRPLLI
ncbi:lipase member I-like [Uranotaenia lowii]|uniref:lipase member I-like n=1 Tax=Uranotaenia lowii TaxID=190385 RepID=UPI0024799E6C|nr:lipase member I-like [Uranotaenia lowii]